MRKIVPFALSMVLLLGLMAGCGQSKSTSSSSTTAKKQFVVGVSTYTLKNPYYGVLMKSFQDNGTTLGLVVKVACANDDQATQLAQIEAFIQQHVDAVVIAQQNAKAIVTAVLALNKAKIPVFFVDAAPDAQVMKQDNATDVQVVESDNYLDGKVVGEELIKYLGSNPSANVGVVNFPEADSCRLRDQGFLDVIKQYPNIHVVATVDGKAVPTTALNAASEMMIGHPEMNIVFSDNGPQSQGVLQAIKSANKVGKIYLFGNSSPRALILAIKDNTIFKAGVQQDPAGEAKASIENVQKYLNGQTLEPVVLYPTPGVTKENADEALTKSF